MNTARHEPRHEPRSTYRPTHPFAPEPSREEQAEHMGFRLGLAGEDPLPPREWGFSTSMSFFEGLKRGREAAGRIVLDI